ncbi:hypothetical protein [Bifidobacterium aerophilum]|uniref:hypothetical protein n=1 Tax=Bifidobacterium aerophilum TaxID=1798155 RepID=UPI0013D06B13|nr:hypothetical protein [Bifidobacterium aerophilum]
MKHNLKGISSLLMGIATACGAIAGFTPWTLAVMAVATGILGLTAGLDHKDGRR